MYSVFNSDSLEKLLSMEANSVDAIVTDPPFGIGFRYRNGSEDFDNPDEYWNWFKAYYEQMIRILRPGGFLAIWQTQLYFSHFWNWFGDDIHIYCAAKNFVQLRKTPINFGYDPVIMKYIPGGDPLRPDKPDRNIDFFVANTAGIFTKKIIHPCPRPVDQVAEIVKNFTKPGGVVCDPFMGSGSTGVACAITGRDFIGIEIDEVYFDDASNRIGMAFNPLKYFDIPTQTELVYE